MTTKTPQFVHLHVHSHYSLLDGLAKIPALVLRAKELGMTALALTDHGAMYGAIEFYQQCKKYDIKPILGEEFYLTPGSRHDKRARVDDVRYHLTLLAETSEGYRNLMKLTTKAHLEGFYYKPRIDKELLREHSNGIICLSGCLTGELSKTIRAGDMEKAKSLVHEYQEIFGEQNYFIEVWDHPHTPESQETKNKLISLAEELNVPLVATHDVHYLYEDDKDAQDILVAVQTGAHIGDEGRMSMRGENLHLTSPQEMAEKFAHLPEALENTMKIAERCNVELELGRFIFPNFELERGKTSDEMLEELTIKGLEERGLKKTAEVEERRAYELEIIEKKNYAPYFLVVADLLRFAREKDIYTTVRGSAAGSLVAYLTGITNVDPLEYQLPFERFLNPFRPSAPDIDMDFADNRRGEVIEYAKQKYGADKVAQIGTFGTMMARGAVRDVARVLGKSYETGDRIAKLIPMGSQGFPMTIEHALQLEPMLKKLYDTDKEAEEILDIAQKLEGTVRHVSVHAAGVVISPKPLEEYTPLQFDPKGEKNLITQYDMYTVGEDGVGLTKLDFLGIRNLAILEDAVKLVKENYGVQIDIEKIPFDDARTFEMLSKGETEGLFQLNGDGMTRFLVDLKPTTVYDINAMIALYRPGPMANIPEYIARKHGKRKITYFHPKAEKYLQKSYGILVYQDDLLFTAMELAGYDWETVDKFRKAVGKKIPAEMAKQHDIFVAGCETHSGLTTEEAEKIWNLFEPFQGYGFNKAHAACYGRVAYQTAYMKANYPAEYMCAVLTAEAGDTDKISVMITEAQRMGLTVLPPDINASSTDFTVHKGANAQEIRFGLLTIKNLGHTIATAIISEREVNGAYKSIEDFCARVQSKDLNKKSVEALIKSGVFDSLEDRATLLENVDNLLSFTKEFQKIKAAKQSSLFDTGEVEAPPLTLRVATAALNTRQKLAWEKELLGLYVSDHPLSAVRDILSRQTKEIKALTASQKSVKVGGIITKTKRVLTKKGQAMVFAELEDMSGKIEVVVFPSVLEKNGNVWQEEEVVVLDGTVQSRDNELKFICENARLLTTA